MSDVIIGIDLGTSNSCVAIMREGRPMIVLDEQGRDTTPSIFAINALQEPIIGYAAEEQQNSNKLNTIFAIKRFIGRKFNDEEVKHARGILPYNVVSADNGDVWVTVDDKRMSPEEISAQVLIRMKEIAEHYLGHEVRRAVITVPAHFNDSQRQATKDAGKIAGLEVMRIINEPTAAALAYGLNIVDGREVTQSAGKSFATKSADRMIAVFDLGGGTFDVSILELRDGVFDVKATNGDTYLGGEDFDLAIVGHLIQEFQKLGGKNIQNDKKVMQRFKEAARHAKHSLSKENKVNVELPFINGLDGMTVTVTRKQMEDIVAPIIKRIEDPCLSCLEDAKLEKHQITDVILVGGMTRMPAIKKACYQIFGQIPREDVNPDQAVALGAAVQGGLLQGAVKGVSLLDVTSLSLGIEVQGGATHVLVSRNSTIPARVTEIFTTSAPNQPQMDIHIIQGESAFAPDNKGLGMFTLKNIKPAPRGVPEIAVTFEVDAEGIIHVEARDLGTGDAQKIDIQASSGLTDVEIDQLLREQDMLKEQAARMQAREKEMSMAVDEGDESELAEMKSQLKSMIFILQSKLNFEGKTFKGKSRRMLEDSLDNARTMIDVYSEPEDLEGLIEELELRSEAFNDFLDSVI